MQAACNHVRSPSFAWNFRAPRSMPSNFTKQKFSEKVKEKTRKRETNGRHTYLNDPLTERLSDMFFKSNNFLTILFVCILLGSTNRLHFFYGRCSQFRGVPDIHHSFSIRCPTGYLRFDIFYTGTYLSNWPDFWSYIRYPDIRISELCVQIRPDFKHSRQRIRLLDIWPIWFPVHP